ncbi:MAG: hypothetical protein GIW95_02150 [Candidatus Eremiobacteraeota bacterium]|nr:hypothetical protein [Candidatus Eremiobacteraeota bacterium]
MQHNGSKLPRLAAALAVLAIAGASNLPARAQTTTTRTTLPAQIPPPTLISPINGQPRLTPVIFQWNVGGSNGNVYGLTVQGVTRGRLIVAQNVASYQLQIASADPKAPDPSFTRVLFQTTTSTTTFQFINNFDLQPGDLPTGSAVLPGKSLTSGLYYWRVRVAQPGAPFSDSSRTSTFRLDNNPAISSPGHELAIEDIILGASPRAQSATLVVATVGNAGTFVEQATTLRIYANGSLIAEGKVPATVPNQRVQLVTAWIPANPGIAQLSAQIDTVVDDPSKAHITRSFTIARGKAPTPINLPPGTIRHNGTDYTLEDAGGKTLATLIPSGRNIDLASFVNRRVNVGGAVTEGALGLLMQVRSISPASP